MNQEFFVLSVEIWLWIFWLFVQPLTVLCSIGIYRHLVGVIAEANFLTTKLIFSEMNDEKVSNINYNYEEGNTSRFLFMAFLLIWLNLIFTFQYIV